MSARNSALICGFGQVKALGTSRAHTTGYHFWPEYSAPEYIAIVLNMKKVVKPLGRNESDGEQGFWAKTDVWSFGMTALEVGVLKLEFGKV